jgi:hypothetical protein
MGGKSKSKSNVNTQSQTNSTMNNLSKGASKLGDAAKGYGNLQTAMIGQMFPAFGELVKGGMESMQGNPMGKFMGAALGMPIQMETPGFIDDFINKYRPPEEPVASPQQQQPYNVNDDMRSRMGMGGPTGQYGQYGQQPNQNPQAMGQYNPYNFGGVNR